MLARAGVAVIGDWLLAVLDPTTCSDEVWRVIEYWFSSYELIEDEF